MKKIISLFALILAIQASAQSYNKVKVGPDEDINLKIPEEFISMSDQDRMKRIYSSKVPLAMFANESQDVTLGINYNVMRWTEKDTELVYGFYKASVNNLFDEIEFIQDEIKEINGRPFIVFEFVSSIKSDNAFSGGRSSKNYTYIQYTSYNNQVLLFNFGCRARLMSTYQSVAKEIMNSVEIDD